MALFNKKFKNIDENYPLALPPWAILGGQIVSGTFILTKISLTAWFCLKHRKSVNTLLKHGLTLTKKIQQDPKFINHLVRQAEGLVSNIRPPDPPPHPPSSSTGHAAPAAPAAETASKEHAIDMPSTSAGVHPLSAPSKAHHKTLEFITEAAQELYAHGQLCIMPYAGYLKEKQHATPFTVEDKL